ncbi:hypothetical protein ACRN93_22170 [Shewanella baltica]|jgi:integrase|uniref:hypothetical protein n=1 Tax=Shewanella baltica TaxID=62322 RepID=UPI003D7BA771
MMPNTAKQRHVNKEENPFVSFNKQGEGVSRLHDDEWDFTALGQSRKKLLFTCFSEAHRANAQDVMHTILESVKSKSDSDNFSVNTLNNHISSFSSIVRYWGGSDFALLSLDKEWKKLKNSLNGHYAHKSLRQIGITLNELSRLDIIEGQYFSELDCKALKATDRLDRQHIALPINIHVRILTQVYDTVEKYHPHRHEISEVMKAGFERFSIEKEIELAKGKHDESSSRFRKNVDGRVQTFTRQLIKEKDIPDFNYRLDGYWLNNLLKDCLICTVFFSGVRKMELLRTNKDSYDIDNRTGISKLVTKHSKSNEGVPVEGTWQTDPIVKKILELAYDSSEFAREIFLEQIDNQLENKEINQDAHEVYKDELSGAFIKVGLFKRNLGKVVPHYRIDTDNGLGLERYGIEATEDDVEEFDLINPDWSGELELGGTLPKFSLHDLRRSFAFFMVRNRLGNALTVKHQFKHLNLSMSKWYANYAELARDKDIQMDAELFAEINVAIEEACIDGLDDIYNQTTTTSGVEGEKITERKRERLQKGERVYLTRNELKALFRSGEKSLVILPTGGYCTSRDCERLCSMSTITEQKKDCGRVMTDKGARRQARERASLIEVFRGMNELEDYALSTILASYKKKILFVEQTLVKHNIPFEKFTDKIKALAV